MGDYSDFYSVRGENKRVVVEVMYKSGRIEKSDFGNITAAEKALQKYMAMTTVKSAEILKERIYKTSGY